MTSSVLVLGDINVDLLMPVRNYPQPGEEATSGELVTGAGGSAANTAIVLARLGVPVQLIGRTGPDPYGEFASRTLRDCGVDDALLQKDEVLPTGITFVPVLANGEHAMFCYRGANDQTAPSSIPVSAFEAVRMLHLSGYALINSPQRDAADYAVELATRFRVPLSLDTALEPALRFPGQMRELLPKLALCVLGMREAEAITGLAAAEGAAAALLQAGVGTVGLKLGGEGCLLASREEIVRRPAFRVSSVDTTGAGDAFSAGLIWSRLAGLQFHAAAVVASALGALATTVRGAGAALPGRQELIDFLKSESRGSKERAPFEEAIDALESCPGGTRNPGDV